VKLAFSTLACPTWSWREAIREAVRLGYDGIEWRLVDGRFVDTEFPREIAAQIGKACADAGLAVPALDSSINLAVPPSDREHVFSETRQMLHLAQAIRSDFLRVFPGAFPPGAGAAGWLRDALEELRGDVQDTGVRIALELHDSRDQPGIRGMSCSRFLADALHGLDTSEAGVQWDLGNPYLEGEPAHETWENIRPWLLYLQVKDMIRGDEGWVYVPMGAGELPVRDVMSWIGGRDFDGWASFEWEKYWNLEIAEPEAVLPGYIEFMNDYR
jgi:sugar phosphate isomerase/epimerase